jgi:hypothetical protein
MAKNINQQNIESIKAILELQEAIANSVDNTNKSVSGLNSALSEQANISNQLNNSTEELIDKFEKLGNSGLEKKTKSASDAIKSASKQTSIFRDKLALLAKEKKNLANGALRVISNSFFSFTNTLKLTVGLLASLIKSIFGLGKAIIMLPFKLLSNLIEFGGMQDDDLELLNAIERVRKAFGDLAFGPAKDVLNSFRELRSEYGSLANSGLGIARIFGVGQAGLAAALDYVRERAEALGNAFYVLRNEFVSSASELLIFNKGLGLSDEDMKAFVNNARSEGLSMVEILSEISNQTLQLANRFNLSSKKIAQDMAKMSKGFIMFGHLSRQELATTAVYAQQAGVEMETLVRIAERFKTFESAAESAAKLNQALGIQIDALKALTADPVEQLKMIQEAFFATGRTINDLNRAEKELLATQLSLSDTDLAAVFDPANAGRSLEEIRAAAADASAGPLTLEESMRSLARSIERVFETGGPMRSFWEAFAEGFEQGLRWWGPSRALFRNIRRSLWATKRAGREFAQMFVRNFPGLIEIIRGLSRAFEPSRFVRFFSILQTSIRSFFNTIDPNDPESSIRTLFSGLQRSITTAFGTGAGSIFGDISEGIKKAGSFILNSFIGLIPVVTDGIVMFLDAINRVLQPRAEGEQESVLSQQFNRIFESVKEVMSTAWTRIEPVVQEAMLRIWSGLKPVFTSLWEENLKPFLEEEAPKYIPAILGILFGPAVISGAMSFLLTGITQLFTAFVPAAIRIAVGLIGAIPLAILSVFIAGFSFELIRERLFQGNDSFGAKLGAAMGALLNIVTLGLMPADLIDRFSLWISGIGNQMFDFVNNISSGLSTLLKGSLDGLTGVFTFAAGLVNIIIGLFTLNGETLFKGMEQIGRGLWTFLSGLVNMFWGAIQSIFELITYLPRRIMQILGINSPSRVFTEIGNYIMQGLMNGLESLNPITWITNLGTNIINSFKSLFGINSPSSVFLDIGTNIIQGLIDGLSFLNPVESIRGIGSSLVSGFRSVLGINSPSTIFSEFGNNIITGLTNGINSISSAPLSVIDSISERITSITNTFGSSLMESFTQPIINAANAFNSFEDTLLGFTNNRVASTVAALDNVVEAYNKFYTSIESFNSTIDIDASVKRFADALSVNNGNVTVRPDANFNVTINLNVTMDADDIATVLSDKTRGANRLIRAQDTRPSV